MTSTKPPKKSETIEIRLPYAAKLAFMERCRRDRRTASEAIRRFIDGQLDPEPPHHRQPMQHWRLLAAVLAGLVLGVGAAAPSLARTTQPTRAAFDQLDRNHDGVLTYQEFGSR